MVQTTVSIVVSVGVPSRVVVRTTGRARQSEGGGVVHATVTIVVSVGVSSRIVVSTTGRVWQVDVGPSTGVLHETVVTVV